MALRESFDHFCLRAGIESLEALMAEEVEALCGPRHERNDKEGQRWGGTRGEVPFHGGKVAIQRPRVRQRNGQEVELSSYREARDHDLLGAWAVNQMLVGVATRRFARSVRLPVGDIPQVDGDGTSKSAVSRRFVAITQEKMDKWLGRDLAGLNILVILIDGLVIEDHTMVAALGIDATGVKHPLSLAMGSTENHTVVQALLDDLEERGMAADRARLFLLDGSKALRKAVRNTYGPLALIQRCQAHKSRNIVDRLPEALKISVRKTIRQAWDTDNPELAEKILRNLAHRLESVNPQAAASVLEGLDEMLCLVRLGLPAELRRSLATTNAIENMMGTIRNVTRNIKRWRHGKMALRWTATAILEAQKGFRRIRAHKQLSVLAVKLAEHTRRVRAEMGLPQEEKVA
ncbi:MAG: IS256 family transposase [Magnetococcales bacterium]|nr:IS256 family transposase [Magnetococcales bacterium]